MKHILVSGSHRSGSTWVGKVLSSGRQAMYIHEPFNIASNKNIDSPLKFWFQKAGKDDEQLTRYINKHLNFTSDHILKKISANPGIKTALDCFRHEMKKSIVKRKIIKDPIALFSADWIYKKLNTMVLILIRHPAAFAESLKNKNWLHDFNDFRNQPEIMKELPDSLQERIIQISTRDKSDIIEHAILLWNIIHFKISNYKKNYPGWVYVRHEDISRNPEKEFKNIFNLLNLEYNDLVRDYIRKTSQAKVNDKLHRDSKKNIFKWKNKLSKEEIDRIRKNTSKIAPEFYSDNDW